MQASQIARKILSGYPDYGKAPREYLLSVTEFIAYQIPEVQEALAHPTTGIATKCKYLPTIADLKEFIEERAKRLYPPPRAYPLFKRGEPDPRPDPERRKAQVLAELGYDPSKPEAVKREPLPAAVLDAIDKGKWSASMLKTPAKPASPELKALLIEQGYLPLPIPQQTEKAA